MRALATGFKDFIMRGNVIDLAVAVVIGAAFTSVVNSLVADLFTPLIGAIIGEPDFGGLSFTIRESEFFYGNFLNALIAFLSVAAVIYFIVVVPIKRFEERRQRGNVEDDPLRKCPECVSDIPKQATRCAFCTAQVTPAL